MADPLIVLAITGLVISLLRLLVFGYLARREGAAYLKLWTMGFMVQIFAQLGTVPSLLGHKVPAFQMMTLVATLGATQLLLLGTFRLLGRKPHWAWWTAGMLSGFGLSVALASAGNLMLASLVPILCLAFGYLSMSVVLFRSRRELSGLGVGLTISALCTTGLHFLDFPFLSQVAWFIPWGLGIALINDVALTVGLVVLTFDRTHAARQLADARYAELADTINVGTYSATSPGRFEQVNGALVRMLRYGSAEELLAAGLPFSPIPSDRDVLTGVNATWRRKDGQPLMVQLYGRVVRDAAGEVKACRGFVVDRTEAHAIAEALSRTHKLDAVGRLAGGVAHDFNNLLTIILSSLELLALKPNDPSLLRDAIEATDQAAQLIRRLLAFGRKQAHHAQPVEVGATTLRTVEMLGRSLGSRHKVETSGVTPGLWINIDAGHLEQVLVNLVLNAKDAMAEGGIIEVSTRTLMRGERSGVELSVKDPGHGMSPEDQARIFEPFFTTREPGRGTGLGLSTVHGIVSQAGGHIEVESARGQGSRFSLWFPDTPMPPPAQSSTEPLRVVEVGKRVLVVDDEPAIRRTVCRMLEAAGHTTREAASGNEAVRIFSAGERFDVLLSDVRMPDGDGPFAAQQVRALAPSTRVVLMSGFQDRVDEATQASADAFLAKPFTRGVLLAAIDPGQLLRAS